MLHCLKIENRKIAYDTASGAVIPLTSLEYKMLGAITPPLTPLCPSSLRYELAKYDSYDVEKAYDHLYALCQEGQIFANENGQMRLQIGGAYGLTEIDAVAHEIAKLANDESLHLQIDGNMDKQVANALCGLFKKH